MLMYGPFNSKTACPGSRFRLFILIQILRSILGPLYMRSMTAVLSRDGLTIHNRPRRRSFRRKNINGYKNC